jgi:hypothetical protein
MTFGGLTLLLPDKGDIERDEVGAAWEQRGGAVIRLDRFWEPPALDPSHCRVYGNDSFCLVLEQKLGLELLSPPDDLVLTVPPRWTGRALAKSRLADASTLAYPIFVKPMVPKLFRARVYRSSTELFGECSGLPPDTEILTSSVVDFVAEARCFVLDGKVLDCAVYEGAGEPSAAAACAIQVIGAIQCPRAFVIDLGLLRNGSWAVVEFNAAWGAGLNGCSADLVVPAIEAASAPRG